MTSKLEKRAYKVKNFILQAYFIELPQKRLPLSQFHLYSSASKKRGRARVHPTNTNTTTNTSTGQKKLQQSNSLIWRSRLRSL